ncbi:acyltransferase [Fulvivirga sp. 29W222]|uniref:Acyltransferase n=1 Tax=Fulvivirga marina TaxID=2494733 RepID=A0A937FWB2_9BACT|nr:acyltransferase [Fulvivirga marina]MBL6447340.1 acyltransferase [Fulvivirga marina]
MSKLFPYSTNRLHGLDHLRAIAIILVMVFHFGPGTPKWLQPVALIGWSGVDLFFVLSGYLIGYQLLSEVKTSNSISFKRFYLKRAFRIIPAYFTVLIVYYALPNLRGGRGMPPLWKFLTFTQNLGLDIETENTFSHAWSLCIEEQFYVIFPLILLTIGTLNFRKKVFYLITGLILLSIVLRLYSWSEYVQPLIDIDAKAMTFSFFEKIYYPSHTRMDGLVVGITIASMAAFDSKLLSRLKKHGNLIFLIGICMLLYAYKISENLVSFNTTAYGFTMISLAYGIILIAAISPTCFFYKIRSRITLVVATLSYSLYLTHKLIFNLTKRWIREFEITLLSDWIFWACFIAAGCVSLILYLLVEKPCLRLRKEVLTSDIAILTIHKKMIDK